MNTDKSGAGRIETSLSTLGEPMSESKPMFDDFWKMWPNTPRKGAKAKCKQVWIKSYCATNQAGHGGFLPPDMRSGCWAI